MRGSCAYFYSAEATTGNTSVFARQPEVMLSLYALMLPNLYCLVSLLFTCRDDLPENWGLAKCKKKSTCDDARSSPLKKYI